MKKQPRALYEIVGKMNPEELELFCENLEVDYYDLGGSSRKIKALNLQKYLDNRSRIHELIAALHLEFPQEDLSPYLHYVIAEQFSTVEQIVSLLEGFGITARDFGGKEKYAWGSEPWREQKAWALQNYMEDNGRSGELIQAIKQKNELVDLSFYLDVKDVELATSQDQTDGGGEPSSGPPVQVDNVEPETVEFANFDVRLTANGENYIADVISSPRGQVKGSEQKLDMSKIEEILGYLRVARARQDDVESLGNLLRQVLFPEEVLRHFEHSLTEAKVSGKDGLRVRMRFDLKQSDLMKLPWEYCRDSRAFMALNKISPFIRFLETNQPDYQPIGIPQPVKILVAIAAPTDYANLNVEAEVNWIKTALKELEETGAVEVKVIKHTTAEKLYQEIHFDFEPHVFHFIGHGDFDKFKQGSLVLEDGQAEPKAALLNTKDILQLLQNSRVRFVVLSACVTAAFEGSEALMGIAPRLVDGGLPAVIAMQMAVPDKTAIAFSRYLYKSLAAGEPLDLAITKARLGTYFSGTDRMFWGIPVLFLRAADGVLWQAPES